MTLSLWIKGIENRPRFHRTPEIWLLYPMNKEMRDASPIRFSSKGNIEDNMETNVNVHFISLGDADCLNGLMSVIEKRNC